MSLRGDGARRWSHFQLRLLADCIDLQTMCKQAHWNVKGLQFVSLHKLFDEINDEVEEYVDVLSDVLAQFGRSVRIGIEGMNELEDAVSADIPTGMCRGIDKWLWLAEAHGQEGRGTAVK